ncbi:MAG: hypothetical protein ABI113_02305 [Mucilaginibacter sp.]
MPPKTLIADETGLSRRSIAKHIAGYKTHPEFGRELEQHKYMGIKVLSSVFKLATDGNLKAAPLPQAFLLFRCHKAHVLPADK